MPLARLAVPMVLVALALSGCASQGTGPNPGSSDRTVTQPTIIRTPVRVPSAAATVPLPGPTGGTPGVAPNQSPTTYPLGTAPAK